MFRITKCRYLTTPGSRRANFLLAMAITTLLSLTATARSDAPGQHGMAGALNQFQTRVAFEINRAFPGDRQEFRLGLSKKAPFIFYGTKVNEFKTLDCERSAHFSMISYGSAHGSFSVGDCSEHRKEVRALLTSAEAGLKGVLTALRSSSPGIADKKLQDAGWVYERTALNDGSELHYFPILVVGHGVLLMPTAVLLTNSSVLVIQVDTTSLCNSGSLDQHRLCKDSKRGLEDLAGRLRGSLMEDKRDSP